MLHPERSSLCRYNLSKGCTAFYRLHLVGAWADVESFTLHFPVGSISCSKNFVYWKSAFLHLPVNVVSSLNLWQARCSSGLTALIALIQLLLFDCRSWDFHGGYGNRESGPFWFLFYDDSLPPGSNWIQWALIHWFKDQCISPLSKMPETTLSSTFIFEWDCGSRFLSFLACKLLIEMKSLGLILNISPNCNLSRSFFILQLHHFPVSQQAAMRCRPTFPERHGCFIS